MNPTLGYLENAQEAIAILGAIQFFAIWAAASLLTLGLVWAIGRWLDR